MKKTYLLLQNGLSLEGHSPDWVDGSYFGEVVFTTGMTGYFESLTDPSYAGQILVFTFPLIGNYGVHEEGFWESKRIYAAGVVVSEACHDWSHSAGKWSITEWLHQQKVPLITGVDTRRITKVLRETGVMLGAISTLPSLKNFKDPNESSLVSEVSIKNSETHGHTGKKVILVDCGMKHNILRCLKNYPLSIHRVPHDYDYTNEEYDGVFLSNGPGDPEKCGTAIDILQKALNKGKPVFGICLGAQLMALAAGAKTYKLRYGHRGHNQPCIELETGRCFITSQNHGYAIDENTLPQNWQVNFRNLNDNTVEGIKHQSKPFYAVQFHPEAAPGPADTEWLFETFYKML